MAITKELNFIIIILGLLRILSDPVRHLFVCKTRKRVSCYKLSPSF